MGPPHRWKVHYVPVGGVTITPLARMLPRILHVIVYYGENGDPKGDQQWDIERLHDVPQQEYE